MGTNRDTAGEVRARALFRHRAAAIIVRIAITVIAFRVVLGYFASEDAVTDASGSAAHVWATIAGALIAAACGTLALLSRRNRQLVAENRRLEERIEKLADQTFELREAEERARSLLEAQGDLIVRRDGEDRVTYANDAFRALLGRQHDDVIGTPFRPAILEQGDVAVAPDGTRIHDQKLDTADGPRWIAWREALVRNAGSDRTETQSVGRDITDRAESERALADTRDQAEAANRAKSRFLAMVSHEIRTPLNGILGMADLLLDTALTAEQTTYAKAVKSSGDTLLSLIEEILDLSKIEAGRLDIEARPFALVALIEEVLELLAPRAQSKGLEIASFVDERLASHVIGDAARLRQVLLNLAGNAIKFTETGGVSVIAEPGLRPNDITLKVRDTGIGIAPEAQARIFLEFEQGDTGPTRKFGGTGLGLAIARRIVERMGGGIAVESRPGAGSTFRVDLTLPRASDATEPALVAPRLLGTSIMLVTQSEIDAPLLARRLGHWGAMTSVITDERAAVALIPERRWDAILVDHAVGTTAVNFIARSAAAIERRIVLIKPGDRHELSALREAGFTGYLVKPIRAASLAARFADGSDAFDRELPAAPGEPSAEPGSAKKGLAILVAEDNEINALLARALLVRLGHRPTIAGNGKIAVESWLAARLAHAPYDLMLVDLDMPDIDGIEAAREIRRLEALFGEARCPIVALTANAFPEHRERCIAAGMDGFLEKPLDRERLAAAIALETQSRDPLAA